MEPIIFDRTAPDAAVILVSAMTWPSEPLRRAQFITSISAGSIEELEEHGGARQRIFAKAMRENMFAPAGGMRTLRTGPGHEALLEQTIKVAGGGGLLAGHLLFALACMVEHHQELPPSLNKAIAAVESYYETWPATMRPIGSDRTGLFRAWGGYRSVSHLWAAVVLLQLKLHSQGADNADIFADPVLRYLILSSSGWFREFALSQQRERPKGPLIADEDLLELRTDVLPQKPILPPLVLSVARNLGEKGFAKRSPDWSQQ